MSFGSGGFGGFGSSTNNQNSSPFGGGGGFGANNNNNNANQATTGGFGTAANTGFGASNANAGGSLFGGGTSSGFGSGAAAGFGSTNQTRSGFGAPATSTGGSLFGGNTNQTSGSGFGGFGATASNTTPAFGSASGGLFGQSTQTQPTGFGSSTGGGLFGGGTTNQTNNTFGQTQPATTGAFGQTGSAPFGQSQQTAQPAQNNGSGNVPFAAHTEKDSTSTQHFQNIVCQQPYQGFSQEELRAVDYNQGRRYGNQSGQAGAFGQNTGFGGFGQSASNTGFGGSTANTGGLFGQQNQAGTSSFGQNANTGFGSTNNTTSGLFGAKPATGTSMFGNTTATSGQQTGGLFGTSGGSTGFGQSSTGFGNTSAGGLFGNNNQKPGGLFGNATAGGFGQSTTGGFGSSNTGTGLFGGNNASNTNQTAGFGQAATTNNSFGGFGQNQNQNQQTQNSTPFGGGTGGNSLFGQNKPAGLFGSSNTGTGLFGQNNQQQASTNLFGGSNNQQNQSAGLFGQTNNQQKPGGLFGNAQPSTTGAGGLFGNSFGNNQQNNNNNNNQGNSLFGQNNQQKPTGGLFGGTQNSTGGSSLFGGSFAQNNNQQQTQGNNLFGGSAQNQQQQPNNIGLLGNSQQSQQPAQQQPQYLMTSISADNPYGNDQLFQSLATPTQSVGPLVTPLSSSQKPRQRAPLPTYRLNPGASSRFLTPQKRTGYGFDYSTYGTPGSANTYNSPLLGASRLLGGSIGRTLGKSASTSNLRATWNEDSILAPGAFSASGIRGGGTGSLKKLKINRSLRTDLFGTDGVQETFQVNPLKKRVSFEGDSSDKRSQMNGNNSQDQGGASTALVRVEESESSQPSAQEQGYLRSSSRRQTTGPPPPTARKEMEQLRSNELAIVPEDETATPPMPPPKSVKQRAVDAARAAHRDMEPGNYYMEPSKAELEKMSRKERSNVSPFLVGREYTGKIEFEKVDLSNIDLDKICGDICRITIRVATVYADNAIPKPKPGNGMNFPAVVTLENSWPRSKGGKLPSFERKGPRYDKHIERLRRVPNTELIRYDVETGEWIFRVPHFSTYTFDYSDDESMLSPAPDTPSGGRSGLLPHSIRETSSLEHSDPFGNGSFDDGDMDDTFEFRNSRQLPGAFDGDVVSDDEDMPHGNGMDDYMDDEHQEPIASIEHDSSGIDNAPMTEDSIALDGSVDSPIPRPQMGHLISPVKNSPAKPKSILKNESSYGTPWKGAALGNNNDWALQLQRTLSPKKQDRPTLRESQGLFHQDAGSAKLSFSREANPFATSIDVMNSLFGQGHTKGSGASAKRTIGAGSKLPKTQRSIPSDGATELTEIEKEFNQAFKPSWGRKDSAGEITEQLAIHGQQAPARGIDKFRSLSTIEVNDGVPRATSSDQVLFIQLANAVEGTSRASQHEKLMWQLAGILFDPTDLSGADGVDSARLELLSSFWQTLVTPGSQKQISKLQGERKLSTEELAILQLSCHDVWSAAETLSEGRDFRLSTMIPQLGASDSGDDEIRKMMKQQIDEWRDLDMIAEIAPAVRALYELLAGNACTSAGKGGASENRAETFNISARFGLDWRRSFALRLWYAISASDPLEGAVELYARDVAAYRETTKPLPWFVEEGVDTHWEDAQRQDRQDVFYGLLKIYALNRKPEDGFLQDQVRLTDTISPQTLAGNPVDSRLSFQLYQSLRARDVVDFSDDDDERDHIADALTTDYALQLASKPELLVDAVFVTLHLSDREVRESGVRALLHRHAGCIGEDPASGVFQNLHEQLHIPTGWIWDAKAFHAQTVLKDDVRQCRFLVKASNLAKAYEVLVQSLAPRCIIEEDRRTLSDVLASLQPQSGQIKNWSSGGALLQDYLSILLVAEKGGDARDAMDKAKHMGPALEEMQRSRELLVRVAADEIEKGVESAALVFRRRLGQTEGEALFSNTPMVDAGVLKKAKKSSEAFYGRLLSAA